MQRAVKKGGGVGEVIGNRGVTREWFAGCFQPAWIEGAFVVKGLLVACNSSLESQLLFSTSVNQGAL